jgi:cytochrome c
MSCVSKLPHALLLTSLLLQIGQLDAEDRKGQELFQKRCSGCHSLDAAKVGPPLRGVLGRPAGKAPGFNYSDALKNSQFTWDESTLTKWLQEPDSVVPDNDMPFRLENSEERAAIVAYLKQLPAK